MKEHLLETFLTPVKARNIFPFAAYLFIFAGLGECIRFFPLVGALWSLLVIVSLICWFLLHLREEQKDFIDLLGVAQFFIIVAHLLQNSFSFPIFMVYFFLSICVISIIFQRNIVFLITVQYCLCVFYQMIFDVIFRNHLQLIEVLFIVIGGGVMGILLATFREDDQCAEERDESIDSRHSPEQEQFPEEDQDDFSYQSWDELLIDNQEETNERIVRILAIIHDFLKKAKTTIYFSLKRNEGVLVPSKVASNEELIDFDMSINIGQGPIGWAAKNTMPFLWHRGRGENFQNYYKNPLPIASLMAHPVLDGHMLAGILVVDTLEADAFSAKDQKILDLFARQISQMFEIQGLALTKQQEAQKFRFLQLYGKKLIKTVDIDELYQEIIRQLNKFVAFTTCIILCLEEKTEKLKVVAVEPDSHADLQGTTFDLMEGFTGWVFQNHTNTFSSSRKFLENQPLLGYGEPHFKLNMITFIPLQESSKNSGMILLLTEDSTATHYEKEGILDILANQYSLALTNAANYRKIQQMAKTDGLTTLINHRHFQEIIKTEFKRLQRDPNPLSLIMLDIDHFKKFNDQYGHPVGDQVLKRVAALLMETCRETDCVARYGGEEFSVLLIKTDKNGAMIIAERIRQTIAKEILLVGNEELRITVSLGVATSPDDSDSKQGLIDVADQALYRAKEQGRNRVVPANSTMPLE